MKMSFCFLKIAFNINQHTLICWINRKKLQTKSSCQIGSIIYLRKKCFHEENFVGYDQIHKWVKLFFKFIHPANTGKLTMVSVTIICQVVLYFIRNIHFRYNIIYLIKIFFIWSAKFRSSQKEKRRIQI